MSDLYKKTYRGYLIDHHSPDPPIITLDNLDIDEYEQFFIEANINNLMVYCKDHWGVTYYDTKVGKKHPGIKGDWIKQLAPVLKKNGIEFNAYYCLEYDNHACISHPEWRTLKADGSPLRCSYSKAQWRMPCYETGYRKYVLDQLGEIVGSYKPDSLFLDIFGKSLCYCDRCKAKFRDIYKYELPESENELIEKHSVIAEFLDGCAKEMLSDIILRVKKIDPDIKVTINFAALYNKEIRDMLDYQFTEPWAGNFLSAAYARDTAEGQYPQLGPGDVSEVYNYQRDSIYELAVAQIAANGCRAFIYSGSQHPDGTLEHTEAKKVGWAYGRVKEYEHLLYGRKVYSEIAIVQDDHSAKILNETSIVANAIGRVRAGSSHRDSLLGAMKLCRDAKIPWRVVPKEELTAGSISRYKAVILPSVYYVDDKFKTVLEGYVKNGGVLIADGRTSLFDADGRIRDNFSLYSIFGADFICENRKYTANDWGGYLDLSPGDIFEELQYTTPPVDSVRQTVKTTTAEKAALFIDPATDITAEKWVNWWSPPPGEKTEEAAFIINEFGKGKAAYAAFNLFNMENKGFNLTKDIFRAVIFSVMGEPGIFLDTDVRNILDYVSYISDDGKLLIIHEISNMAEKTKGDVVKVKGGVLRISKGAFDIAGAKIVYPYEKGLKADIYDNYYSIELPEIDIHNIMVFNLNSKV